MRIHNAVAKSFSKAFAYNESKIGEGLALRIGGNFASSGEDLSDGFLRYTNRHFNPRFSNVASHIKVSFSPKDDRDKLTPKFLNRIAEEVVSGMGYQDCPYITYQHFDTDHPHIHIVASRVNSENKVVSDSYERIKMRALSNELEDKYELVRAEQQKINSQGVRLFHKGSERKTSKEKYSPLAEEQQNDITPLAVFTQQAIIESWEGEPTLEEFLLRLERKGFQTFMREFERGDKKFTGLSFSYEPELEVKFKESYCPEVLTGMEIEKDLAHQVYESGRSERLLSEHPYYDVVDGRLSSTENNKVMITFYDQKPPQLKAFHIKGSTLGPAFTWKGIQKKLTPSNDDQLIINKILLKGKKSDDWYSRKPLIYNEGRSFSKLIAAMELGSESALMEAIGDGASMEEMQKFAHRGGYKLALEGVAKMMPSYITKTNNNNLEKLVGSHTRIRGKGPDIFTKELYGLASAGRFDDLVLRMKEIRVKRELITVDPIAFKTNEIKIPVNVRDELKTLELFMRNMELSRGEKIKDSHQKAKEAQARLEKYLLKRDQESLKEEVKIGLCDLSIIDPDRFRFVSDPDLKIELSVAIPFIKKEQSKSADGFFHRIKPGLQQKEQKTRGQNQGE